MENKNKKFWWVAIDRQGNEISYSGKPSARELKDDNIRPNTLKKIKK
jgi:hypothetical protein